MADGSLSARAPQSRVMISANADVRETTTGVPQASDSSAASPKVSCGPGANATSAEASIAATVGRSAMKPVKSDRQPGGLPLQPCPQWTLTHDDQPRVYPGFAQYGERVDAAVGTLLHR